MTLTYKTINDFSNRTEILAALEECSSCVESWKIDEKIDEASSYDTNIQEELNRLETLKSYSILDSDHDASFERLTGLASRIFDVPICLVSLVDFGRQWFLSNRGLGDVRETPRNVAFCAHAIRSKHDLFIVPDATKDDRFKDNALVTGEPNIRFYAGAPLGTPEGYRLGTLCIIDTKIRPEGLDLEEKQNLREMAAMVTDGLVRRKIEKEQRLKDKGQVIACTAHDILTPLTCIQLNMEMLGEDNELRMNEVQTELWKSVVDCSKLMVDICHESISSFRKETEQKLQCMENGTSEHSSKNDKPDEQRLCISELLRDIKHVIDPYPKMVPLTFDVDEDIPDILVKSTLSVFRSALNYLSNACRLTEKGHIIFRIKVDKDENNNVKGGKTVLFECEDTGPGIKAESYKYLFLPFSSKHMKAERCDGSLGIGLYSVSRHIESLGGHFGHRSMNRGDTKTGSLFWFSLPLKEFDAELVSSSEVNESSSSSHRADSDTTSQTSSSGMSPYTGEGKDEISHVAEEKISQEAEEKISQEAEEKIDFEPLHKRRKKALVIDDSVAIRKVINRALAKYGFEVCQAENGMIGLNEMKRNLFDLVFCDFLMPIMDGIDCVKQLREWEKKDRPWFEQQIIGISAHANDEDIKKAMRFGMNQVLPKPLGMSTIKALCDQTLKIRE